MTQDSRIEINPRNRYRVGGRRLGAAKYLGGGWHTEGVPRTLQDAESEAEYDAIVASLTSLIDQITEFCLLEDDRMDKLHQIAFRNRALEAEAQSRGLSNLVVHVLVQSSGELRQRQADAG